MSRLAAAVSLVVWMAFIGAALLVILVIALCAYVVKRSNDPAPAGIPSSPTPG